MPTGSSLFAGAVEYEALTSPAPESSVSAVGRRYSTPFSTESAAVSTPLSHPKKRKLRAPETWKHFRVPREDEAMHQNNQRLWYCQHCHSPPWRTVSTTSAKRHMRTDHGIILGDEERPAKKALQQSLEVAFAHAEENNRQLASREEQSILLWRSMGPLGKLHNIAVFIRSSTMHSDAWQRLAGRALGIDNATRWNSWYMLLRTALEKKDKLMVFQQEHHKALGDDSLTQDDWDVLQLTVDFLQPFWQATLAQQDRWSSLDQLLYHMDILLKHFEDAKQRYSGNQRLIHSIRMGWFVLDKYYFKTDETPVYSAALLLHPSKRLKYLRQNWHESWHDGAINKARQIWAQYKDLPVASAAEPPPDMQMTAYDKLAQSLDVTEACDDEDELEKFMNGPPCKIVGTPLKWWTREEQRMEYPRLHKMAIDVLSIAPMSDKAERVFSGARRTVSYDRARLGAESIEMTECLGSWNRNDLIRKMHVVQEDDN